MVSRSYHTGGYATRAGGPLARARYAGRRERVPAAAIALAIQVKAAWPLLDERAGRRVAKALGIKVTGVVGILLRARREGSVPSLRRALEEVREPAGFRMDAALVADGLRQIGEDQG